MGRQKGCIARGKLQIVGNNRIQVLQSVRMGVTCEGREAMGVLDRPTFLSRRDCKTW
jgi:hypothetical protein